MEGRPPMNFLPPWIPRSVFGGVLAGVYILVAIWAVAGDRKGSSGGWISLNGMTSFLVTFPVSWLGEMMGMKLDHRRNVDMGFTILVCAGFIYLIGSGLGWLARVVF